MRSIPRCKYDAAMCRGTLNHVDGDSESTLFRLDVDGLDFCSRVNGGIINKNKDWGSSWQQKESNANNTSDQHVSISVRGSVEGYLIQ